jgi:hypothetical protein
MHLIALHDSAGSGNPLGVSGNYDRLPFAPYFLFKDLVTIFLFIIILSVLVFFMPNLLGDSDNYVMANPMQTPPAIVPEWYLLPFYAILRSIPNKLLGVIAMLSAILILLAMPYIDLSRSRGIQFRPLSKIAFYIFVANFLILMVLGAKHVESPFIEFGQISTVLYFAHFLIIVPLISLIENSLIEISNSTSIKKNTSYINSLPHKSFNTQTRSFSTSLIRRNDDESIPYMSDPDSDDDYETLLSKRAVLERHVENVTQVKAKITAALEAPVSEQVAVATKLIEGDPMFERLAGVTNENAAPILNLLSDQQDQALARIKELSDEADKLLDK